jgi:hypothetical protein
MRRLIDAVARLLLSIAVLATVLALNGCYSAERHGDNLIRVNRVSGETCLYRIDHDEDGNEYIDVFCDE